MINVTDKFKQAMKEPVKMVTASLVLDDNTVITGQDKLIKITIDSSGHLFGTATSVINIELFGTNYNLVDHTFSVVAKTLIDAVNDTWEEANLGLFYVEESTADFEKKTTKIKGYDLMGKLAKTPYNSGTIQFPCTVKELINQLAGRFDFTVDTNLDNLPNITYQIPEDLYVKISNCTYRDILGEIAGATATIAVFNGKTLSFRDSKKKPDEDEIWTYDNLKTLKYKPKYGPVNSLVLARTPQEDNVPVADNTSVANNGRTEVKLANNEILDDDRRKLITPIFNSIKDFSHHPFEAETTGFGWYKPGDLVLAQASGKVMNGQVKGDLKQSRTNGYNLLTLNGTKTSSGANLNVKPDGFIEAKGTLVNNWMRLPFNEFTLLPGTYTISREGNTDVFMVIDSNVGGNHTLARLSSGETKTTFTVSNTEYGCYIAYLANKDTNLNISARFMLEAGSVAHPYEPSNLGYQNLFDEFSGLPVTIHGAKLENKDGILKLTGKPAVDWLPMITRGNLNLLDKTEYTVVNYAGNNEQLFVQVVAIKKDGTGKDFFGGIRYKTAKFTTDSTKYSQYDMKIGLNLASKYPEPVNLFTNVALYKGGFNDDNFPGYTPYASGFVTPRPKAPQTIKELTGGKVSFTGKNLVKFVQQNPLPVFKSVIESDGSITLGGNFFAWWGTNITASGPVFIQAGVKYTLSIDKPLPCRLCMAVFSDNGRIEKGEPIIEKGSTSCSFTMPENINRCHLYLSIIGSALTQNTPLPETNIKVQLEYGDTATEFTPFETTDFNLPSGVNLYKLTDTIYDEVKLENGVAKLIKRVGKLELTGEEEKITHYFTTQAGTIGFKYKNPTEEKIFVQQDSVANIICSHFKSISEDATYTTRENRTGVAIYGGYKDFPKYTNTMGFWFTVPDQLNLGITDVASFKNWLKAEKAKGTPVTVYYEMQDYQTIELGRTNLNQVYVTDTHLELGNGIKETIKGVAPTATQTDYARAGGITKTIYNTEIKVDKQKQEIESIVSKQTQVDQQIADEFSKITQNIKNVVTTIQTTGGGNLIKNSVGYAKNQDGTLVEWTKNNTGEVKSYTSPESRSYGAISGNAIELKKGASITQRLNVASSGKIPYSLSFRAKKGSIGTATVKLSNTIDSFVITIPENKEIIWQNFDLTKIDPSMNYLDVTVSTSNNCEQFLITDLMVNMGDQVVPWVQANGEILNTQVAVNDQGMMVSSSVYSGDYVQITPLGMSGHSNVTGTDEEVFKLNRDVTETSKLSARKEINMDPIKIVPVKDGERPGWYFVG
nr:MAG TPA: Minor structural protein putative tail fiber [Caudoviricetes sp.]